MGYLYPQSLQRLINALSRLPGLGPKAAQRMSFALLTDNTGKAEELSAALLEAVNKVHPCPCCGNYTDTPLCSICNDSTRDQSLLCAVESVGDIISMERSGCFNGLYHVLGGVISPMDGIGPEQLNLVTLGKRLKKGQIKEVLVATNPNIEGEATALYLAEKIKPLGIKVSRIAHGMPIGGTLAYADEATLTMAVNNRHEL